MNYSGHALLMLTTAEEDNKQAHLLICTAPAIVCSINPDQMFAGEPLWGATRGIDRPNFPASHRQHHHPLLLLRRPLEQRGE